MAEKRFSVLSGKDVEFDDLPSLTPDALDERGQEIDRRIRTAERRVALADAEVMTLTARVQALTTALMQSEQRVLAEGEAKKAAQYEAEQCRLEMVRMRHELDAGSSVRAMSDEMKTEFRSVASAIRDAPAPVFELSFTRDSSGRIKTPVVATPRKET